MTVKTRDPGRDLKEVLAALGAGLGQGATDGGLPGIFEQHVRRLLAMRSVRLREVPARYNARLVTPTRTSESIVIGVPTAESRAQAILEASFEPGRTLDEGDFDLLTTAAHLGGLVLEAARVRPGERRGQDGAAPLIGSTPPMKQLRARIERVALTDFTVLIEGPIDP